MKRCKLIFNVHPGCDAVGEFVIAESPDGLPPDRDMARALRVVAEYYDREADRKAEAQIAARIAEANAIAERAATPPAPTFEPGDQVVFTGSRARLVELGLVDDAIAITNMIGTVVRGLSRPLGTREESIGVSYAERRCAFAPSDLALVRKGRL